MRFNIKRTAGKVGHAIKNEAPKVGHAIVKAAPKVGNAAIKVAPYAIDAHKIYAESKDLQDLGQFEYVPEAHRQHVIDSTEYADLEELFGRRLKRAASKVGSGIKKAAPKIGHAAIVAAPYVIKAAPYIAAVAV